MFLLILYYLILPFLLAGLVLKFIRKYGRNEIPEDILRIYSQNPLEKKWFRVLRRDHKGLRLLGDRETHDEAVELAYKRKEEDLAAGEHADFLVLNSKGEILEEVDS